MADRYLGDRRRIAELLSRADLDLCPVLKTPLNDVSTMNKTMEYMAYALPSVSFNLVETRVTGGDTVLYVPSGDIPAFTDAVERLIDDPDLRLEMALRARERGAALLAWRPQAKAYVSVYDDLTGTRREAEPEVDGGLGTSGADEWGNTYVPLDDAAELARFIIDRKA